MTVVLWAILAILVGLVAIVVKARRAMPPQPPLPPDVELPDTPLQRASQWSLGTGLFLAALAVGVVAVHGPEGMMANDGARLLFTILLIGVLLAFSGGGIVAAKLGTGREGGALDERDRAILERAPAVQGLGAVMTLVVWTLGLMEWFHETRVVPLDLVILLFWSRLVVYAMGLPVGILVGYRRS